MAVILRLYAILYLCLGESALCFSPQVEADSTLLVIILLRNRLALFLNTLQAFQNTP